MLLCWRRFLRSGHRLLIEADILLRGCTILPMNNKPQIENGVLAVKDGRICFIGKGARELRIKAEIEMDAAGMAAIPGLINCHTHVPMTLFRGIADDQPLESWLKKTIWPLEAKLQEQDVYAGALLGCFEMIKSGTTCFADMYFHEHRVAEAVEQSGLRAMLAEGIIGSNDRTQATTHLEGCLKFAADSRGQADGRVGTMLGPHSAYSCSPELLADIARKACELEVGIHIHLAESRRLFDGPSGHTCRSEVELLDRVGFLGKNVLAAHCIDLSARDMQVLAERNVNVAYVPVSNMKLGLGAAKIKDLTDLHVNVGLGTDGPASNNSLDMFETMKVGALLQKLVYGNPAVMPAREVLEMATMGGARALSLSRDVGSLEVGKKADIVLLDLAKAHLRPFHDVYSSIVYCARGSDVDTVIVDGRILMQKGQVKTLDEAKVMRTAEEASSDLLSR